MIKTKYGIEVCADSKAGKGWGQFHHPEFGDIYLHRDCMRPHAAWVNKCVNCGGVFISPAGSMPIKGPEHPNQIRKCPPCRVSLTKSELENILKELGIE